MTIPNITLATYVTLLRLLFVPCIVVSMMYNAWGWMTCFFVLASVTDMLDGMIARARNEVSWLGTMLDPLVDKVLLITVYTGLVYGHMLPMALPGWFLATVIVHEVLLLAGVCYWSLFKHHVAVSPSRLAKLVGLAQFLFIFWALVCGYVGIAPVALFSQVVLLLALARMCVLIQYSMRI